MGADDGHTTLADRNRIYRKGKGKEIMATAKATAQQQQPSAETATAVDTVEVRLAPADIAINPVFDGLRSNRNAAEYQEGVKRLASIIAQEGQKQPVLIRSNTTGSEHGYELVFGHRRREAVALIQANYMPSGRGDEALLLCRFEDLSDAEAMQAALTENFQAEDFTVMDKARIIMGLRISGKMKTKAIAEYLGVSTATVTETEKLLDLPPEVQAQVEQGVITKSAALEVAPVKKEKRQAVVEKAQAIAEQEEAAKPAKKPAKGAKDGESGKAGDLTVLKPGKAKVEAKHVRKAIRQVEGAVERHKAPNRADIIDMFEQLASPAYARPLMELAQCALAWIAGKLSERQLKAAWGDVEDCLPTAKVNVSIAAAKALAAIDKPKVGKAKPKATAKVKVAKAKAKVKAKKPAKVKAKAKAKAKRKK